MTILTGFFMVFSIAILAVVVLPMLTGLILARVAGLLAPLWLLAWLVLHGRKKGPGWERFQGVCFAHRGLHHLPEAPENSLTAFHLAAQEGCGVELDVHLTKDGHLAVIHDAELDRVCGAPGTVAALTAEELRRSRLTGTGEAIPFLEEVAPLFVGKGPLLVELKPDQGNWRELSAKTVECLDRFQADYCIESFDPRCLLWLRQNRPEILRGQLTQNFLRRPEGQSLWNRFALTHLLYHVRTRPDFIACRYEDRYLLTWRLCRYLGMRIAWWTVRTPEELAWVRARGDMPIFENMTPREWKET